MNVAIIPARGGSVRIPRKNIKDFHGKPILAYSIETAMASGLFDKVVVSTDDTEIMAVACGYGAEVFMRRGQYDDSVGTQARARDVLRWLEARGERVREACCIYPCAPMLMVEDLHYAQSWIGEAYPFAYVDGWNYYGRSKAFLNETPLERGMRITVEPSRYIDINTPEDWVKAEAMYAALRAAA